MNNWQRNESPLALITGASQGLGFELAQFLAARGFDLIITARNEDRLRAAEILLKENGGQVHSVVGDVADPRHREDLFLVLESFGQLDLLVNNASTLGPLPIRPLMDTGLEELRMVFEVNTLAPLALIQAARPLLSAAEGLVINLSSDAARGGYAGWGAYGSSKAALDLISATLANELAAEKIFVVSVDPGDMRTAMHQNAYLGEDISDRPLPDVTIPFWAWLLGQEPQTVSGQRFEAQGDIWQVTV